jgi:hypothetical protein
MERTMKKSDGTRGKLVRAMPRVLAMLTLPGVAGGGFGCGGKAPAPAPACDRPCKDGVAVRALRETMKFAFNKTLQGNPVGQQDETAPCLDVGVGTARIYGTATSNSDQGTMDLKLTYVFDRCFYTAPKNAAPERNFSMTLTGTISQNGTLSVQPSATTALIMTSPAMAFSGTVYEPAVDYTLYDPPGDDTDRSCALSLAQSGSAVSGTICGTPQGEELDGGAADGGGRSAGFTF